MEECRFLIDGHLGRSPFHYERFSGQLSVKHESKSRSLQQRRRRLEREEPNPKLVLCCLVSELSLGFDVTNAVTYPQGIIKHWTVSYIFGLTMR